MDPVQWLTSRLIYLYSRIAWRFDRCRVSIAMIDLKPTQRGLFYRCQFSQQRILFAEIYIRT